MVRCLDMHGHWVNSIALSSDHVMRNSPPNESEAQLSPAQRYAKATGGMEERMVSCSDDHTLCLWLPSSKKPVARMTGHMQPVNHVAFSPDGSMIASASFDKSVKIWDGRTGIVIVIVVIVFVISIVIVVVFIIFIDFIAMFIVARAQTSHFRTL